jgi:hypothetical protein
MRVVCALSMFTSSKRVARVLSRPGCAHVRTDKKKTRLTTISPIFRKI